MLITGLFLTSVLYLTTDFSFSKGLNAKQAEFAVKKYRSHRRCGPSVMMSLGLFDNPL